MPSNSNITLQQWRHLLTVALHTITVTYTTFAHSGSNIYTGAVAAFEDGGSKPLQMVVAVLHTIVVMFIPK